MLLDLGITFLFIGLQPPHTVKGSCSSFDCQTKPMEHKSSFSLGSDKVLCQFIFSCIRWDQVQRCSLQMRVWLWILRSSVSKFNSVSFFVTIIIWFSKNTQTQYKTDNSNSPSCVTHLLWIPCPALSMVPKPRLLQQKCNTYVRISEEFFTYQLSNSFSLLLL